MTDTEKLKLIESIINNHYEYRDKPTMVGLEAVFDAILVITEFGGANNAAD